ncbi:LysM peptidoglycan-binding domain-containing protein [Desulfosporosinus sp. SB140]|uniref:LysM peptidoglycan-binding domain-containing protein n=1 Tax=Desulfosporosinus paludis TaxID=3115649 RepID=UPI00388D5A00
MKIHVVQQGETLGQITSTYGINTANIIQINGLPDQYLVAGLALVIPSLSQYYTVKPGDTLWKIAQQFGTNITT